MAMSAADVAAVIDSGTVRVPGTPSSNPTSPALMEHLYIRAFIAADVDQSVDGSQGEHAWRALAWSDSVPLVDLLRFGEQRSVPRRPFVIPLATGDTPADAWLGFAITGDAVNPRASTSAQRLMRGGVRVYVCDPKDVTGRLDDRRVMRLRDAYTAAC